MANITSKLVKVSDLIGFEKIGIFELNHNKSKSLIRMIYNKADKRFGSHIYIIAINDFVYKIGCSVTKLSNYAGYGVGNAGQPSDRTTGIHYYIARELYNKNKVDFYIQMCHVVQEVEVTSILGDKKTISCAIDPKVIESFHLKTYFDRYNCYPIWNKQEQGRTCDWDESIKKINNALKQQQKIEYVDEYVNANDEKDTINNTLEASSNLKTDLLLQLYHWKYNDIPLPNI